MVGATTVRVAAERPAGDRTCQSVSRVKRTGADQVVSAPAWVRATITHAVGRAGAAQTLTRSRGTAVPVSVWAAFHPVRAGPLAVGANTGSTATRPVTAEPKRVDTRQVRDEP